MLATKLLNTIRRKLVEDQGEGFAKIFAMMIREDPPGWFESSGKCIGASAIGKECPRDIWYDFHWASPKRNKLPIFTEAPTTAQQTALEKAAASIMVFQRGNLEELRARALLVLAGVRLWLPKELGKGGGFYFDHTAGRYDGAVAGVPDDESEMLFEGKSVNKKGMDALEKGEGIRTSKIEHHCQVQIYMHHSHSPKCLYFSVCKDDERMYAEIVSYDAHFASRLVQRTQNIVHGAQAPARSHEATYFWCKDWCDHRAVCHEKAPPVKSCRSCSFASVVGGDWHCAQKGRVLSMPDQKAGCEKYTVSTEL
jgi:hypothetical protein